MNKELIERFFSKQCTAEEAKRVAAYLKANPSVLEEYLSLHEWENTVPGNTMPDAFWREVWQNIRKKNRAKIISLRIKQMVAAASIILVAGSGYYYFNSTEENAKSLANVNVHKNQQQKEQNKTFVNNTKKSITVILEDSSVIELSPASIVQYQVPFPADKRDIVLEGEATFHVAKNKQKPFTVYAGALATTALGTIFSVKKSTAKNIISVKLFKGRVVIHSSDYNLKGWNKDVYLLPGEQLNFNEESALLAVERINNGNNKQNKIAKAGKQQKDPVYDQLTFNNTSLPEVMDKLSACYNAKINYDSLLIGAMNFTGTISRNDSLEIILKAIAQMNGLEITKTGDEFIISKHE